MNKTYFVHEVYMQTDRRQIDAHSDAMGGENDQSLGALSLASMEAKQPREPSHKQSFLPLEEETATVHQQEAVDPISVVQPFFRLSTNYKLKETTQGV